MNVLDREIDTDREDLVPHRDKGTIVADSGGGRADRAQNAANTVEFRSGGQRKVLYHAETPGVTVSRPGENAPSPVPWLPRGSHRRSRDRPARRECRREPAAPARGWH